jgi:hypothetical protein
MLAAAGTVEKLWFRSTVASGRIKPYLEKGLGVGFEGRMRFVRMRFVRMLMFLIPT